MSRGQNKSEEKQIEENCEYRTKLPPYLNKKVLAKKKRKGIKKNSTVADIALAEWADKE